jgi:hypothetical protein
LISSTLSTGTLVRSGDQFTWDIGNLNPNAGAALSILVEAPSAAQNISTINDNALVQSETPDPNPADGSANLTVAVGTAAPPTLTGSYNKTSGTFILNVGGSGDTVTIETSTNLANSADWVPVATNTAPFSYTNTSTKNVRQLFYRAVTP